MRHLPWNLRVADYLHGPGCRQQVAPVAGTTLPVYELVCAFLTPPIVLGTFVLIVAGLRRGVGLLRGLRPLAPFHALVVLYFLSRTRENAVKAIGDPGMNASLVALADKLEQRLDSIETLLDREVPGWRKPQERRNV